MRRIFVPVFFLLAFSLGFFFFRAPGGSAAGPRIEEVKILLNRGVEKGLNLDEKASLAEMRRAIELDRENPLGYAYLAMAYLFFYETSFEEKEKSAKEASMFRAIEETQIRAEKRIEKDPRDGQAFFALAVAKMVKNRWEIIRKNYFRAFRDAQSVWEYLGRAREFDPENYDVYYPMGVLHFHLAQLSGIARWAASVFITPGDREKGIEELELASEKGNLMKDLARANLLSVYSGYERQPDRALLLAESLREKYPRNYNFSFALANVLSALGRFEEAVSVGGEIERGIRAGASPYRAELWPRYHQLMGRIFLERGEYEKATGHLNLALQDHSLYNARIRAWALVRLGMIHDARKERKMAEEYYQKALEVEGGEGLAQRAAREYLQTPYSPPAPKESPAKP